MVEELLQRRRAGKVCTITEESRKADEKPRGRQTSLGGGAWGHHGDSDSEAISPQQQQVLRQYLPSPGAGARAAEFRITHV